MVDKSKYCLTAGMVSVMTIICSMFGTLTAWLILLLMAKSSTSVDMTFIIWWIVFAIIFWPLHIYEIEVATLFIIMTLDMTITVFGFKMELSKILSNFFGKQSWLLYSHDLLDGKKWSGNISFKWKLRESSL